MVVIFRKINLSKITNVTLADLEVSEGNRSWEMVGALAGQVRELVGKIGKISGVEEKSS